MIICDNKYVDDILNTNSDYFNLIITPNTGLQTGDKVTVQITATSTAQYTKTLKARFTLVVGKESLSYEIVDSSSSQYLDLNITNTLSYYKVQTAFDSYNVGDKIDVDTFLNLSTVFLKKFILRTKVLRLGSDI